MLEPDLDVFLRRGRRGAASLYSGSPPSAAVRPEGLSIGELLEFLSSFSVWPGDGVVLLQVVWKVRAQFRRRRCRSAAGFLVQDLDEEKILPDAFIDQDLVARRRATQVAFPKFRRCLPSGMEGGLPSSSPAPVSEAQRWLVCGRRRHRVCGCVGVWLYRG